MTHTLRGGFPHLIGAMADWDVANASLSLPPRDFEAKRPAGLVPAGRLLFPTSIRCFGPCTRHVAHGPERGDVTALRGVGIGGSTLGLLASLG